MKKNEFITILFLSIALALLFVLFKVSFFLILAAIILVAGTISKTLRRIISAGWLKLAHFIGAVNAKILLSLVFFVILTPLAVLRRAVSLMQKHEGEKKTNWQTRNHFFQPRDLEKMW